MYRSHYLEALQQTAVLTKLAAFHPQIVGTPPLGLDLPTSDIDIICFVPDVGAFTSAIWNAFSTQAKFRMWERIGSDRSVVANFDVAGWTIELFGQAVPVLKQYGWRHFVLEQRLLALGGDVFRVAVMQRRYNGMKNEAAFAAVLGLDGDPYEALLGLERCSEMELTALLRDNGFS